MTASVHPLPPCSLEAEQAVLGSVLLKPTSIERVADILVPTDFYRPAHQEIYRSMLVLYERNVGIDYVTLSAYLREQKKLDEVGGTVFLAALSEQVGTALNVQHYADMVRDKAAVRRIMRAAEDIARLCLERIGSVQEFRDQAEARFYEALESKQGSRLRSFEALVPEEQQRLEESYYEKKGSPGLMTGFYDLDHIVGGFWPGELILLAARPSMGKTALACNISYRIAMKARRVGYFSLEMTESQLVRRFLAASASIDGARLKRASLHDEEWERLAKATQRLRLLPIWIDDTSSLTALDLRTRARRLKFREGLDLLVVDYLQLLKPHKGKSREQEVTAISQSLKGLAKELGIPVLALSQLSREVEKRPNKLPVLSDLRESGSLEQDADVVIFIYREESLAQVKVAKQRDGSLGEFELFFKSEHLRFENKA